MTEEELAKKWVEKECGELRYEKCERKDFIFTFYELKEMGKQAFLAGLKADRLEWHNLRENPEDLPKKTDEYLVYRISGYGSKSVELIQYNSSRHFWCVDCQNEIKAWKEIVLPELPKELDK